MMIPATPESGQATLYPLRFDPIFQYRPWGGRRLSRVLSSPLPDRGPIGEAWLLSDRDDYPSIVSDGPFKGATLGELFKRSPEQMVGSLYSHYTRFPLLLKFLDVQERLSVQVHPSDAYKELIPPGENGKTEGWVVLETGPNARVYAGLDGVPTAGDLRHAITIGSVTSQLHSFVPRQGDGIFLRAGTVHSLSDAVVFEVQENSDVTFRLFDWNKIDPQTGHLRCLQVDQALACINLKQGPIDPVMPRLEKSEPIKWEKLIRCDHFGIWRISGDIPFMVGAQETCRVVVCISGQGRLEHAGVTYSLGQGDVLLLPASVGACCCHPEGNISLLEILLPEISVTP